METQETIDDIFDFLQNKTIKDIGSDHYDNKNYLVILLSDGSLCYISSSGDLFMALERHLINQYVMKFLPAIAALLSIVWYCIRIFEWARSKFKK